MKAYTRGFTDIFGEEKTDSVFSRAYLALKLALERGETAENVRRLTYDWLSQRRIPPSIAREIIERNDVESAVEQLTALMNKQLVNKRVPALCVQTLERALKITSEKTKVTAESIVSSLLA